MYSSGSNLRATLHPSRVPFGKIHFTHPAATQARGYFILPEFWPTNDLAGLTAITTAAAKSSGGFSRN